MDWSEEPEDVFPPENVSTIAEKRSQSTEDKEWPGNYVEMDDFEKWDLVAWPKKRHELRSHPFHGAMQQINAPFLKGRPMNVGYVKRIGSGHLEVIPVNHRYPKVDVHNHNPMDTKIVKKDSIVARKDREHNDRYQEHQQEQKERRAQSLARCEWRDLPWYKRWSRLLTLRKASWIKARKEQNLEEQ